MKTIENNGVFRAPLSRRRFWRCVRAQKIRQHDAGASKPPQRQRRFNVPYHYAFTACGARDFSPNASASN
jgi:hypothetical protein